jgi:DNA modification methylase
MDTQKALTKDMSEVRAALKNINWSFYPKPAFRENTLEPFNPRKYHWYPATYIPEIPYSLIEILTEPGARVFDPFMGIGTTFFQALILERAPYGNDLSKIAYKYVDTLYRLFDPQCDIETISREIKQAVETFDSDHNYRSSLQETPYFAQFERWFSRKNLNAISFLTSLKDSAGSVLNQDLYAVVTSAILNSSSDQDRGMGCIADNMLPKPYQTREVDVCKSFLSNVTRLLNNIQKTKGALESRTRYALFYESLANERVLFNQNIADTGKGILQESYVDIVISSPPYPNMVDYTTSHRLAYYYYGIDLDEEKKLEVGARYRRRNEGALRDYAERMKTANERIVSILKPGGLLCYVMPAFSAQDEQRKQIIQSVIAKLEDEIGLAKEMEIERVLPTLRRTINTKWTTLEKEMIYIYRKK